MSPSSFTCRSAATAADLHPGASTRHLCLPGSTQLALQCPYCESSYTEKEMRQGEGYLLIATDIAARGVDLPETTHIYNFDLLRNAVDYLHRAGRAGRKPFSGEKCNVTNIIKPKERFVLQKYEDVLMFNCEEVVV
ncbi:DEAD-box ATP-dependent RNA helicase 58, chloroplastic [Linum perenne]